jgi:hypothetical protein
MFGCGATVPCLCGRCFLRRFTIEAQKQHSLARVRQPNLSNQVPVITGAD